MKINMAQIITDLKGNPMKINPNQDGDDNIATLGFICKEALLALIDAKTPGPEKFSRYKLAMKIDGKDMVDLSVDEVAKIKDLVGTAILNTEMMGCAWEMLDPQEPENKNPLEEVKN